MAQTADHPTASASELAAYHPGDMDIAQQRGMYHTFNTLLHWGALILATGLTFFVLWLCGHVGFLPALIAAAIVIGLGSWWLTRPKTH